MIGRADVPAGLSYHARLFRQPKPLIATRNYVNMSDINSGPRRASDEELRQAIELLFFAYRDFTAEPDSMLARIGLGRAHHRAVYFVGRNPGIAVKDLLAILKITKQSLARVLAQLVRDGYIVRTHSRHDRRMRLLHLTQRGIALERELTRNQRDRIDRAFREAGGDAAAGFRGVMLGIMDASDRWRFDTPPRPPGRPGHE